MWHAIAANIEIFPNCYPFNVFQLFPVLKCQKYYQIIILNLENIPESC